MKSKIIIRSWTDEARNYSLSDYPSVKAHFKCNETSGGIITEEKSGATIDIVGNSGTLTFGSPAYSITTTLGSTISSVPLVSDSITAGYFAIALVVMRCQDDGGKPTGSASFDTNFSGGIRNGAHLTFSNAGGTQSVSLAPQAAKTFTVGYDYILATIFRPTGGSNLCECAGYDLNGVSLISYAGGLVPENWASAATAANTTLTDSIPFTITHGSGNNNTWYQKILYQFATEPTDLAAAIRWHGACAPQGIKGPYPGWKGKT